MKKFSKVKIANFYIIGFRERKINRNLSIFLLALGASEIIVRTSEGRHRIFKKF